MHTGNWNAVQTAGRHVPRGDNACAVRQPTKVLPVSAAERPTPPPLEGFTWNVRERAPLK
jgi:hypothetical protein